VVINLPKLKTHRKTGMTCALKNLVGINGNKDWLPHHRKGAAADGGDEYLKRSIRKHIASSLADAMEQPISGSAKKILFALRRLIISSKRIFPFPDPYMEGSWWGNDTIPRTVADLNRILLYADSEGNIHEKSCRKILHIVDAVICGEGEGPIEPDAKECGLIMGCSNAAALDAACAAVMGFDPDKIPVIRHAFSTNSFPIAGFNPGEVMISFDNKLIDPKSGLTSELSHRFNPSSGWRGHIEKS
ncbi:MAG TPA: DUF362 domain-containing protein, partial [bacterium]|nr:DUF362 domain-containing protein [bacterium]